MTGPFLSFCIPVYNCGNFLPAALDSILDQLSQGMEVVVYDGGSTDGTPELMRSYAGRGVRYHRSETRGGIDADLATCIGHAQGQYCWLFSGDDVLRSGAVARAVACLEGAPDVLLCRHAICDIGMHFLFDHDVLDVTDRLDADFADPAQRLNWFSHASSTEAFFSFISGILVRKAAWDRGVMHPQFSKSCWAHAVRLLALSREGLRVRHVPEIWLNQRGENDSFVNAGVVNRYRIAIEGYQAIGSALFGPESGEAFHIRRVLRKEFTLRMFLNAKVLCLENPSGENRALLDSLYRRLHQDRSVRSQALVWAYRLTPARAAALLRLAIRAVRRARR
jgi:abequosyltransferase